MDRSSCVLRLSVAWNISISTADTSVGILISDGLSSMSSNLGSSFSSFKNALMSADALAPIVPANAHITALSPSASRFFTMTDALASERGDTKDRFGLLGWNMYGLSS